MPWPRTYTWSACPSILRKRLRRDRPKKAEFACRVRAYENPAQTNAHKRDLSGTWACRRNGFKRPLCSEFFHFFVPFYLFSPATNIVKLGIIFFFFNFSPFETRAKINRIKIERHCDGLLVACTLLHSFFFRFKQHCVNFFVRFWFFRKPS